jgi:CDP-paratose 2-epimerase
VTRPASERQPVLVIGGAGFIGSNLARDLLASGRRVTVLDNLSRPGVARNLDWLRHVGGDRLTFVRADIRDPRALDASVGEAGGVFQFAAQTAVTTSLDDPQGDFAVNAQGTLNVLEAVRRSGRPIPVIFSSTNKVYGSLADVPLVRDGDRYLPADPERRAHGIGEDRGLAFCTPYGCSKGVADQYVLDYAASYGLPTAVLRMSCIYGPRQFGTEDQGWVAHFVIAALRGEPITVYGNGSQVRDILFIDDAVAAYRALLDRIDDVRGRAFNLGGGPVNAVSVNAVLAEIERLLGRRLVVDRGPWRQGDQRYFVADTRRLRRELGWQAAVDWRRGQRRLTEWLAADGSPEARRAVERAVA